MEYLYNTDIILDKNVHKNFENVSFDIYKRKWHDDLMLNERSKLRTYRLFKNDYVKEEYLSVNMPGKYKCSFAKLRCGVAPLKIETGRYEGVSIENRTCFNNICNVNNCIENDKTCLLQCPVYADLHCYLFEHACFFLIIIVCSYLMKKMFYFYSLMKTYVFILPKSAMTFYLKENVFYIVELLIVHKNSFS